MIVFCFLLGMFFSQQMLPDAYHHLYLEYPSVRHEALQDTVDWITARIPAVKNWEAEILFSLTDIHST